MTVIAIGLDSAEPSMLERYMNAGALPNFQALRERGSYGRLENFSMFSAELPWTTFATGVMPKDTGYWTPLKYHPDYRVETRAAYEYDEYPAFFALGPDYRVCAFDVPQVRLQRDLNGWQCNAWGAHSPQIAQESNRPADYQALLAKHGPHPGLHRDYAQALDMVRVREVYDRLMIGIERRGDICADLLSREPWDLFLTVYGEPHGAGHTLWQLEPDHPLHGKAIAARELLPEEPMGEILKAIDRSLAKILAAASPDDQILVFSAHGMGPNTMDLPSIFFLPELLYRDSFGRAALGDVAQLGEPVTQLDWGTWERSVWNTLRQGSPLAKLARRFAPTRVYRELAATLDAGHEDLPLNPYLAQTRLAGQPWFQPALWYSPLWPRMRAFALPSFAEGYIRLNVKGREQQGVVEPEDFQRTLTEICELLRGLKCARTGIPMVRELEITRQTPFDTNAKLADPDIVIAWQEEFATDAVEHDTLGRIGPVPHYRAGSHRHTGLLLAAGGGLPCGVELVEGHVLDLAPTILAQMGVPKPAYMTGRCLPELMPRHPSAQAAEADFRLPTPVHDLRKQERPLAGVLAENAVNTSL